MPIAQLKNMKMNYSCYGDKNLPAVVLLAGLSMPAIAWPKEFLQKLTKKGLYVITMDNRDSGDSERFSDSQDQTSVPVAIGRALLRLPVQAPYRLEDMALDTADLMDYLEIQRAHAVGVSMGGMIAQVLATIRPSRVKSLIPIMSASGNPRTGVGKIKTLYSLFSQPSQKASPEEIQKKHMELFNSLKSPKYEYPQEVIDHWLTTMGGETNDYKATERQLLAILASGDRSEQLKRLSVPTLVMHGEDDPLLPLAAGKELAEIIPNATLKTFPLMGHDLPDIHYESMASAIAEHVWSTET
ncbi:MAG: alpha/beta hydrolase [Burkholderiales bacterium]|nr:alpha/beta hydrolase [Burkholderiales bacterium]